VWYHYTLEVPANTPATEPVWKDIELTYGIIVYIAVVHPRGCKAMVETRIYRFEHQIFPNNSDEAAKGDNVVEGGELHYPLLESPFTLRLRGISPGTTYAHSIPIHFNVLPLEVAEPWRAQLSFQAKVKRLLGIT
jgi:hypothetical protein